jgi:hypothetical protein
MASDLPGGLHQLGPVQTFPNLDAEVVDENTCTLHVQPYVEARRVTQADYWPVGASADQASITERIVSFSDRRAARRSFERDLASHVAGTRCGTVTIRPVDSTATPTRFRVQPFKLGTIAEGSFAERTDSDNAVPSTVSVTFVSRSALVILAVRASENAPTAPAQVKSLTRRAEKRLRAATTT